MTTKVKLSALKDKVENRIGKLQESAERMYGHRVPNVKVVYDLKSTRTAGMAIGGGYSGVFKLRLHEAALAEYGDEYINDTVIHEFAHLVQMQRCPASKPHGNEWQTIMRELGGTPTTCHKMNLPKALESFGVPVKKGHMYKCGCRTHELSTIRHNKVVRGTGGYTCKTCHQKLVQV